MPAHTHTYQDASVTDTAETLVQHGFTAAQLAGAINLFVTPHDGDIVYRVDGTDPTATVGHIIQNQVTTQFSVGSGNWTNIKFIRKGSSNVQTTMELEHIS